MMRPVGHFNRGDMGLRLQVRDRYRNRQNKNDTGPDSGIDTPLIIFYPGFRRCILCNSGKVSRCEGLSPARDALKIARHFNAGLRIIIKKSPGGTTDT